jgi:hypothetical protein
MQAQAYEGYVESGQFYPKGLPIRLAGRFRAVLTILDVPTQADALTDREDKLGRVKITNTDISRRLEWLNRLEAAVALSENEDLPDWPFERSKELRPPLDLADKRGVIA